MSLKCPLKRQNIGQAPVVHAYNPSYSGGRNQKDTSSKPAQTKKFTRHIQKPCTKIWLLEWMKEKALSFKPQYYKKQNKTKTKTNYTEANLKQSPKLCYFL
jgi:hypothetical protein